MLLKFSMYILFTRGQSGTLIDNSILILFINNIVFLFFLSHHSIFHIFLSTCLIPPVQCVLRYNGFLATIFVYWSFPHFIAVYTSHPPFLFPLNYSCPTTFVLPLVRIYLYKNFSLLLAGPSPLWITFGLF